MEVQSLNLRTTRGVSDIILFQWDFSRGVSMNKNPSWYSPLKEIFTLTDFKTLISCYSQDSVWDFPGGPGVKTPCLHCKGHGLNPWLGKVKVKVAQSCPTLCVPIDYTIHGILQARILEWVAFLFSRGSSQPRDRTQVSCIAGRLFTI